MSVVQGGEDFSNVRLPGIYAKVLRSKQPAHAIF